jgi:hypothetical protein
VPKMDELQKYKCNLAAAIKQLEYWITSLERDIRTLESSLKLAALDPDRWGELKMQKQEKLSLLNQYERLIRIITVK